MRLLVVFATLFVLFACANNDAQQETKENKKIDAPKVEEYVERYADNQSIKIVGTLKNGKREGLWTAWHKDGKLESEVSYINGERDGVISTWYANGSLRYKGRYAKGKQVGEWVYYAEDGNVLKRINYDKQ